MPIADTHYPVPLFLPGGHLQTIFPVLFRASPALDFVRKSINTPDGDFFIVDELCFGHKKAAVLLHGLEGESSSAYMLNMAKILSGRGYDVFSLNHRGCGGLPNRLFSSYHSGFTTDLDFFLTEKLNTERYDEVALIGFSLGGNILLKYLGEKGNQIPTFIKAAVAVSVPCDLAGSAQKLSAFQNRIYLHRFIVSLKKKIRLKSRITPAWFDLSRIDKIKNFRDFDDWYTAPAHGFDDANHYWGSNSSLKFMSNIKIPTLLINAKNDPFLSKDCIAVEQANENPFLYGIFPEQGGHVGFFLPGDLYWHEERILDFLQKITI